MVNRMRSYAAACLTLIAAHAYASTNEVGSTNITFDPGLPAVATNDNSIVTNKQDEVERKKKWIRRAMENHLSEVMNSFELKRLAEYIDNYSATNDVNSIKKKKD